MSDRFTHHHLTWTTSGQVWAAWRLQPLRRPRTTQDFESVRAVHYKLLAGLVGHETLLEGVLGWTDASSILDAMLKGVDTSRCPAWVEECEASVERLTEGSYGRREYFLHVRLHATLSTQFQDSALAAANTLAESVGLAALPPSRATIEAKLALAESIEAAIPSPFAATRLSPWERVWLARNSQTRTGEFIGPAEQEALEGLTGTSGRATVGRPVLDPGGLSDLPAGAKGRITRARAPLTRRFVKVTADTGETSYQSNLVLSVAPPGKVGEGLPWRDAAFLGFLDDTGEAVDWSIRTTVHGRSDAGQKNKAASRKLTDQLDQVGEGPSQSGRQMRLWQASEVLTDYAAAIELDDTAVETRPLIMLSVAGADGESASRQARKVSDAEMFQRFVWARPAGAEAALYQAGQPGEAVTQQVRDYAHVALGSDLAATIPLVDNRLGHGRGVHIADDVSSPLRVPVLLDLMDRVRMNEAPSIAWSGRQGSGKSASMKTLAGAIVDRGGRMITLDVSTSREWFAFADSLRSSEAQDPATVDVADPTSSLDVLRMMPPEQAGPMLLSFLVCLLNVPATSAHGRLLAKVLKPGSLQDNAITSAGALHTYLAKQCKLPGASEVADRIDVFVDTDGDGLAAAVFDSSLPAMDLSARAIVIGTSSVSLPAQKQLEHKHLFDTLPVEMILGRALYALLAELASRVCLSDRMDPAVWVCDEAHTITRSSDESLRAVINFLRHGRREKAGLLLGSHDPDGDFVDTTLRGLISNRLVMRQTDLDVAKNQARFIGLDPEKAPEEFDQAVETILAMPENSGAGILRDGMRRIGEVNTVLPARPGRREAACSTPPETAGVHTR